MCWKIQKLLHNDNIMLILTIFSVISGIVIGILMKFTLTLDDRQIYLISFPGEVLMNMLKMLIVPLLTSSLITALSELDSTSSGKIGLYTVLYYTFTTIISIVLGLILVTTIHPGNPKIKKNLDLFDNIITDKNSTAFDSILDLIRNIIPPNLIEACFRQMSTSYEMQEMSFFYNNTYTYKKSQNIIITQQESTNVLGLLSFSIMFALILRKMKNKAKLVIKLFNILNKIIMEIVKMIMWYFPIGICFLIIGKILEIQNLTTAASSLGLYILTVLLGLFIHGLFVLPLLYFIITKANPFRYFPALLQAWITAFGTASSTATLPIAFKCLQENNLGDKKVVRFVLPVGATINMDGTALYEAVAAVFIAQINGRNLSFGQLISLSIIATFSAIGASCVPSSGLVTMIPPLVSVGLPIGDISMILTVDWFLDRVRTTINVLGDSLGSGIIGHLVRNQRKSSFSSKLSDERKRFIITN